MRATRAPSPWLLMEFHEDWICTAARVGPAWVKGVPCHQNCSRARHHLQAELTSGQPCANAPDPAGRTDSPRSLAGSTLPW